MICRNCGNEMRDDARFCPSCGALNGAGPDGGQPQTPAAPAWEGPEGGKKKTGLIVGVVIAAVAVVALLVFVLGGLFSNPKKQVEAAFVKSAAAYAAAEKKLDLPDTAQWQKDQEITQTIGLELKNINSGLIGYDLSALSGLGLDMFASYNGGDRWMSADLRANWGEDELLTLSMKADDAELYFNSPQITGETHYGVNTETMGADIARTTGDDEMKDVSFNMFDLVDLVLEKMDQEAMEERFKTAGKALWEEAQVKKLGAKTLSVNGAETKTAAYQVVLPEEALNRYVDELEDILSALNYYDLYNEMFQAMGMPREELEDFLDELEDLDIYGELADGLRDAIDELGDLELEVCLSGGYVSAVGYEGELYRSDVSIDLYLGGGEEYVDDLSLNVEMDGGAVEVKSTGDHGLKSGVYTDETTVRVRDSSSTLARVTSDMTLDPSKKADNFQWKLGVDSSGLSVCVLDMAGSVYWGQDQLSLNPVEINVRAVGMDVCTLSLSYHAENHADKGDVADPRLVTQMDADQLEEMVLDTQKRAMQWASDMENLFMTRLPSELLWAMMGAMY